MMIHFLAVIFILSNKNNFTIYDDINSCTIYLRYNNDAQYRGRIDPNGMMNGLGTYIFPDGSSIGAIWHDNKPSTNIIYREPLGFAWVVEDVSTDVRSFSLNQVYKLKIIEHKYDKLNMKVLLKIHVLQFSIQKD